jgi:hypothetical protein
VCARVGAVDLVDQHDRLQAKAQRLAEHELGLRQRAFGRVDQQHHAVDHRQDALDLAAEVGVAGVSTMLTRVPFQTTEVALARMVMPRSRSRSFESMARSATCWLSRKVPLCLQQAVNEGRLAMSTCAMIATLRMSIRCPGGGLLRAGIYA